MSNVVKVKARNLQLSCTSQCKPLYTTTPLPPLPPGQRGIWQALTSKVVKLMPCTPRSAFSSNNSEEKLAGLEQATVCLPGDITSFDPVSFDICICL